MTAADLALPPPAEGSREAAARVAAAREGQEARLRDFRDREAAGPDAPAAETGPSPLNAQLEGRRLERFATPDEPGRALMTRAAESGGLSARGWTRTLRLARTIADLDGAAVVRRIHVAEALIYRRTGIEPGPASQARFGLTSIGAVS